MQDNHNKCNNANCRCLDNNHGEKIWTLKDGVRVNDKYTPPKNEPLEFENSQRDAERLEELLDNGRGNNSEEYALIEITELLITSKHLVSIIDIVNELNQWWKKFNIKINSVEIDKIVTSVLSGSKTFSSVKQICFKLGQRRRKIIFDKSQLIEVAFWLMGRYHIKRVELTGNLLSFNDRYYEKDAEALIRRKARECLVKSKNSDMNEIVKYIEDTCQLIKSADIEKSVHLKCLLNGTFDIKSGTFAPTFSPDHIILNQIPHDFDENSKYDEIEKRVGEIIVNEKDKQSYYDFISTCLHPYTGIDIQLGNVGIAGTGKTQLTELARMLLGEDNVSGATIHSLAKDPTTQIDVAYSFLNIDEELKSNDIDNIEVIKKWVTQGIFTGRSIYSHNTTFRPTSRLMWATNTIYEIANPDDALAIYERSYLLKLIQKFRHTDKEIKNVFQIIEKSEFDGCITYLLKNATWIYEKGNIHYPQSTQKTESLWNEYGNEVRGFIERWLEKGVELKEQSAEIWNKFFSEQLANDRQPRGRNQFHKKFDEIVGTTATQIRNGEDRYWGYLGFKLKTVDEKDEQQKIDETPKGKILKIIQKLEIDSPKLERVLEVLE